MAVANFIKKEKSLILLMLFGILWMSALSLGFIKFYNYEFRPGTTDYVSQRWPTGTIIPRQPNIYQLIIFAHPKCPCTKASLGELELIMAKGQGKVRTSILFAKPKPFNDAWVKSDLYKSAAHIPGVEVMIDEEGKQAKLFGATTSGQTFLYNPQGELVFTGGITASRGHLGENPGENAIVSLIHNESATIKSTPFFGCGLADKESQTLMVRGKK